MRFTTALSAFFILLVTVLPVCAEPPPAPPSFDAIDLVGKWRFTSANGRQEIREFKPDGTFIRLAEDGTTSADGKVHAWKIVREELILSLADGEGEVLALPVDPKGTDGKHRDGSTLVATKVSEKPTAGNAKPVPELPPGFVHPLEVKIPNAIPVPGKPGFVFSPYDHTRAISTFEAFRRGQK
jgi:hypothetical protein